MLGDIPLAVRAICGQESPTVGSHGWQAGDVRVMPCGSQIAGGRQRLRQQGSVRREPGNRGGIVEPEPVFRAERSVTASIYEMKMSRY